MYNFHVLLYHQINVCIDTHTYNLLYIPIFISYMQSDAGDDIQSSKDKDGYTAGQLCKPACFL
jgi:hypothetical protein